MNSTSERRSGRDRRQQEVAYPPDKERRHRIEQRKLEFEEITMDEQEWQQLFVAARKTAPPAHNEEASHVLERASRNKGAP